MGTVSIDSDELQSLLAENKSLARRVTELQARGTEFMQASRSRAYGGILSGKEIDLAVGLGDIRVTPYSSELVNPASLDLRLGSRCLIYIGGSFDCKKEPLVSELEQQDGCFRLSPGELYLMHTAERISAARYVPVLDGKSSIGRLGIKIHETAGYGDPGFDGQYTLEVSVMKPTRVYVGMRFCQIRFHSLVGEVSAYQGKYSGEFSEGPVPSRCYKQFEE